MGARFESRAVVGALLCGALALTACSDPEPRSSAREVTSRADLPGGVRALGALGDYMLENPEVRVVVQAPGYSRGFGVFGGSLIDAVRRPAIDTGVAAELPQQDHYGELFPGFFLQAVAVDTVEIVNDGSDGEAAVIEASGLAGDFLEVAGLLNRLGNDTHEVAGDPNSEQRIRFSTRYELPTEGSYVKITFAAENISDETLSLPSETAQQLLPLIGIPADGLLIPIGDVSLFGNTNDIFVPGIGFDIQFGIESTFRYGVDLPAFPGMIADFVATRADGVSYGLVMEPSEDNYLVNQKEFYPARADRITDTSLLIPFVTGGFMAIFYEAAPTSVAPGETITTQKYFIIGTGDVASVLDQALVIWGRETGSYGGRVIDEVTGHGAEDAWVMVYRDDPEGGISPWSQNDLHGDGSFRGTLEPGTYYARVAGEGRVYGEPVQFEVRADEHTSLVLTAPGAGRILVHTVDESGRALPARAVAVGAYDAEFAGQDTREFLFDLEAGEDFRSSDLVPDEAGDAATRRYIEATAYTDGGQAELHVRPGVYQVVSSRGPEYDTATTVVEVAPGDTVTVGHTLRRVVDTRGWLAIDTHLHSINSIDAGTTLNQRVRTLAAEGVEWGVATDHNYITDYEPAIWHAGLQDWLRGTVGLELTTLESGHFNAYPIRYELGTVTNGAFQWAARPPDEIFEELRSLGSLGPERTIVQVNHPRDSILGYFNQYDRDALTTEMEEPGLLEGLITDITGGGVIGGYGPAFVDEDGESRYSLDFEALEILNGKLFWTIHHFRDEDGEILLDDDDEVAFPGAVDDWYNLLNLGHRFIGVGSSDVHGTGEEAGFFRTMAWFGVDDPRQVDDADLVDALRSRRVVGTNGPMLDFWVEDREQGVMGSDIVADGGAVSVGVELTAAPWVSVSRVNIVRNGVIADVIEVDPERDLSADPLRVEREVSMGVDEEGDTKDSWFLVQAIGHESYFPVVRPLEIPPFDLVDALGSIAGPLGFGDPEGGPPFVFPVTAYAITNPVWVHTEEGEFDPPGIVPVAERSDSRNDPGFESSPTAKTTLYGERVDPQPVRYVDHLQAARVRPPSLLDDTDISEFDIRRVIRTFDHGSGPWVE